MQESKIEGKGAGIDDGEVIFSTRPSLVPAFINIFIVLSFLGFVIISIQIVAPDSTASDLCCCMSWPILLVTLVVFARGFFIRLNSRYQLLNDRLVYRSGIFARSERVIPLGVIQEVTYKQSIIQRIFKIADVLLNSGVKERTIRLVDLANYESVCQQILTQVEKSG